MKKLLVVVTCVTLLPVLVIAQQVTLQPDTGIGKSWQGLDDDKDIYPEISEHEGITWYRHDGTPISKDRVQQAIKQSLQNVVSAALIEACSATIRPTEMILALSAGVDFYAVFSGSISLKFNLAEACHAMAAITGRSVRSTQGD